MTPRRSAASAKGQRQDFESCYYWSSGFLLAAALLGLGFVTHCEGHIATMCAQFGIGDVRRLNLPYGGSYEFPKNYAPSDESKSTNLKRDGYWSIGAKEHDSSWITALHAFHISSGYPNNTIFRCNTTNPNDICTSYECTPAIGECDKSSCPWTYSACRTLYSQFNCIYETTNNIEMCVPNDQVEIRMYLIKQNKRVLRGWIHVEIELKEPGNEIELLYVQMRDELWNAIGEFVSPDKYPEAKCTPSNPDLVEPTMFQHFPCSATGSREPKTSHGIFMAKKEHYVNQDFLKGKIHTKSIAKGIHFLWKMDEFWCSRHQRLQPFANIFTKKAMENATKNFKGNSSTGRYPRPAKTLRKIPNHWVYPKWFGTSDRILNEPLDCTTLVIDDGTGALSPDAVNSWFANVPKDKSVVFLDDDSLAPKNIKVEGGINLPQLCQANPYWFKYNEATNEKERAMPNNTATFSGRCKSSLSKDVSHDEYQDCQLDQNAPEFEHVDKNFFQGDYHKFVNQTIINRTTLCTSPCYPPSNETHVKEILTYPEERPFEGKPRKRYNPGVDDPRTNSRRSKQSSARRFHGTLATIVTMFVTPLSSFMARHYKETFMKHSMYGMQIWYWVHWTSIFASAAFILAGHTALMPGAVIWGRSTASIAVAHIALGYVCIGIFAFLLLTGGCRCVPRVPRLISMTIHSILGFAYQYLSFLVALISCWVPMSPTLKTCNDDGQPIGISWFGIILLFWFLIEIVLQVVACIMAMMHNRTGGVKRAWWCPIVPIFPSNSQNDLVGSWVRVIIFWVYLGAAGFFTFSAVVHVGANPIPEECMFGNTTCESRFGCTTLAKNYDLWLMNQGW